MHTPRSGLAGLCASWSWYNSFLVLFHFWHGAESECCPDSFQGPVEYSRFQRSVCDIPQVCSVERTLSSQPPAPSAVVSAYVQKKPLGADLLGAPLPLDPRHTLNTLNLVTCQFICPPSPLLRPECRLNEGSKYFVLRVVPMAWHMASALENTFV